MHELRHSRLVMPKMSGFELLPEWRGTPPPTYLCLSDEQGSDQRGKKNTFARTQNRFPSAEFCGENMEQAVERVVTPQILETFFETRILVVKTTKLNQQRVLRDGAKWKVTRSVCRDFDVQLRVF